MQHEFGPHYRCLWSTKEEQYLVTRGSGIQTRSLGCGRRVLFLFPPPRSLPLLPEVVTLLLPVQMDEMCASRELAAGWQEGALRVGALILGQAILTEHLRLAKLCARSHGPVSLPPRNQKLAWEYETHGNEPTNCQSMPTREIHTYCVSSCCKLTPNYENHCPTKGLPRMKMRSSQAAS